MIQNALQKDDVDKATRQNKEMSEQEKSTKTEQTVVTIKSFSNRIRNWLLSFAKKIKQKFGNTTLYPPHQL